MTPSDAFRAPEGTRDILPDRIPLWEKAESAARAVCARYGYLEVRPPVFEFARLFHKSTGETTDIVEKEMFTFGNEEKLLSLRPELTPSVVRILIEHNLHKKKGFWKLFYIGPAFRHEAPQAGRQRQFHQFGVEALGSESPLVDVESILLFRDFLEETGIRKYKLRLNSIGCPDCRPRYREALREAIRPRLARHCENCRRRFERNVFRILDCKEKACIDLTKDLPSIMDHVCSGCRDHFAVVEKELRAEKTPYRVDSRIVRGLDYYTRTVFEFKSPALGAQDALCGGGRYDGLVGSMGGPEMGAMGFASGMERILMAMEKAGVTAEAATADFHLVCVNEDLRPEVFRLANALRSAGLKGDLDFEGRSLQAQMRTANKTGVRFALILGPEEAAAGTVQVKDMRREKADQVQIPQAELTAFLKGGGS